MDKILKVERQQVILELIGKSSKVLSNDLSNELGVSEDTIRRDLKELSDKGLIRKVHGGAVLNDDSYIPMNYTQRINYASKEKKIIAEKAISLLEDEMTILIDGGTTNLEIAKRLPEHLNLKVYTNCLPIASELVNRKKTSTFIIGGEIMTDVPVTVGGDVMNFLNEIKADIYFMGTRSIDVKAGLSDIERSEVLVKRKMAESSDKVVSVATSDKIASEQNFKIIDVKGLDYFISELDPKDKTLNDFRKISTLKII
jgi:DeoR/GlpR family transcriptional regulator of sugar metabolism